MQSNKASIAHPMSKAEETKSTVLRIDMLMFKLIESGDWDELRKELYSRRGKIISNLHDETGLSILSLALGNRAPKDVVELIITLNPKSVLRQDSYGAMPLHIGCLNGMSADTVQKIIEIDGGLSARTPDRDRRTPLHHAVEYACLLPLNTCDSSLMSLAFEQSMLTIEAIVGSAPETVLCLNTNNESPLDIPQLVKIKRNVETDSQLDEVYNLLKEISIEVYRKKKKHWESRGFDVKKSEVKNTNSHLRLSIPNMHYSDGSSSGLSPSDFTIEPEMSYDSSRSNDLKPSKTSKMLSSSRFLKLCSFASPKRSSFLKRKS